jgi:hypothetical protein
MKDLPIGIQTFSDIILGNYLYIDKTKDIYNFFDERGKFYFLSRPRRFGKSLLVSTLKEIFSGNRDLFKDLWIYDKLEWQPYTVITLDLMKISAETPEVLKESLKQFIHERAAHFGLSLGQARNYKQAFVEFIEKLSARGKIVILIDEYDKPIIDFVENQEIARQNRDILKNFYSTLKGLDEYLRFVFITGVSKFSKVSVFSDLNNLNDITLDEKYAVMLGYTHRELLQYFDDRLDALARGGKKAEWLADIRAWYNGYSWDGEHFVYNPFSILNLFQKGRFANYWFESGSPSFLVRLINKYDIDLDSLEHYKAGEELFSSFDIERMHVASLLFQTGYLTIKEIQPADRRKRFYILSYPNAEVKEAFLVYLLGDFSPGFADRISVVIDDLKASLKRDDMDRFFEIIRSIFARIPYNMFVRDREGYYQTVIYIILKLIGINITTELETNQGRIDAVVELPEAVYIMEFKLGAARQALQQIKENKYFKKYLASSKTITLIGIGFDSEERNLRDYKIEKLRK